MASPNDGAPPAPEAGIADRYVMYGIVVGLILVFLGIGLLAMGRGSLLSALMTCVGFGIVLASFGSKAGGSYAGWSVTGAGAMAIALFLVLQQFQPAAPLYKTGKLRADLSKIADIRIIFDVAPIYLYRDKNILSYRFILLDHKLRSERLSIQVDTTEKGEGLESFEMIADAKTVQSRYLAEDDKQIQWEFDYNQRVVKDGKDVIFSVPDSLQPAAAPQRSSLLDWLPSLEISSAFAQGAAAGSDPAVVDYITKLKSDDASVRRNAREDLAAMGAPAVGTMMSALRSDGSDYRVRLGVVYALSQALKHNPDQRSAISSALKSEDFPALVAAASDDDKTIRQQGADFLYTLQDPRALPSSIEAAKSTTDSNKVTNQVLIIGQSGKSLTAAQKESVLNSLRAGPVTNNNLVGNSAFLKSKLDW
jgi:hypothetical protein